MDEELGWDDLDALKALDERERSREAEDEEEDAVTDRLKRVELDWVGPWSVRKAEMVAYYAQIYSNIINRFTSYYLDGYANRGVSRLRGSDEVVSGSAVRVLSVRPSFSRYFLIEADRERHSDLQSIVYARFGNRDDVDIILGDANLEVPGILSTIRYEAFERALAFLDPYNMHGLKWPTIVAAGQNRAVDAIIHFPTMDANRTVLKHQHGTTSPAMLRKMTEYWGDESWEKIAYTTEGLLPFAELAPVRTTQAAIVAAFRDRLRVVAGFSIVGNPIPMRASKGQVIYHLLFASHDKKAAAVMRSLESRFRD